jgi:hypothetical protein
MDNKVRDFVFKAGIVITILIIGLIAGYYLKQLYHHFF